MSTINKHITDSLDSDTLVKYISIIVNVCSADGLSTVERDAVNNWISEQGKSESLLEEALALNFDAKGLDTVSKNVFGPSIVLDAFRFAAVDGLSAIEKEKIYELGEDLGMSKAKVQSLENILSLSTVIGSLWTQVNS